MRMAWSARRCWRLRRRSAHHGFSSEYDENNPVTLTGAVSKIEWMNPHARFDLDVKDADGKVQK